MREKKVFKIIFYDHRAGEKFYERVGYFYDHEDVIDRLEKEDRVYKPEYQGHELHDGQERGVYTSTASDYNEPAFMIYIYEVEDLREIDTSDIIW